MRLWRIYLRVALGGFVFLIPVTALLWAVGAVAAGGFYILAAYWVALSLAAGLILALARLVGYGR
jgi:hypothetical protein